MKIAGLTMPTRDARWAIETRRRVEADFLQGALYENELSLRRSGITDVVDCLVEPKVPSIYSWHYFAGWNWCLLFCLQSGSGEYAIVVVVLP